MIIMHCPRCCLKIEIDGMEIEENMECPRCGGNFNEKGEAVGE